MAASYDLAIDQGSQFDRTLTFYDSSGALINNTGFTAKAQIALYPGSTPLITLTNGSGLVLGGVTGTIQLTITAAQTLILVGERYYWDLLVTDVLAVPRRYLQGIVTVSLRVTS